MFNADRTDQVFDLKSKSAVNIPDRSLLWVDAIGSDVAALDAILDLFGVDAAATSLASAGQTGPLLQLHGTYFRLRVGTMATVRRRERTSTMDLIAGHNFVLTLHDQPLTFMADFDDRIKGDTPLGEIDSAAFAAVLLDALVTSYLSVADELGDEVDDLDGEALRRDVRMDLLTDLVALRHRISMARRALTDHREVFAALTRPDFEAIAGSTAMAHFNQVGARFERAIDAVEATRDSLVGTFGIHATRTAQRTNDIVKILTMVTVLLLPTTVIAGFMGMNIKAPYSNDDPTIFWIVVAAIAAIAVVTVVLLRLRRWL